MFQTNVSLSPYNTFGIEATAAHFAVAHSVDALREILSDSVYQTLPKLILGGGSNVLFTKDFEGLVIKNEIKGIEIIENTPEWASVKVGAGEVWHAFVLWAIEQNLGGIENLSLIPGTVGAAPMQNIGAYGVEIKDVFVSLEALNLATLQIETFDLPTCQFGYRESIFKHQAKGKYVIVSVTFRLSKPPHTYQTGYGDIQKTLAEKQVSTPNLRAVSDAIISIRQSKLPNPAEIGNAGSFFKNPEIPLAQFEGLKAQYETLPGYPTSATHVKVPAGWLIEQAGWKGHRQQNVGVHTRQALVLVNYGGGTGLEIKALAGKIQASVSEKFGIALQVEVNFVG